MLTLKDPSFFLPYKIIWIFLRAGFVLSCSLILFIDYNVQKKKFSRLPFHLIIYFICFIPLSTFYRHVTPYWVQHFITILPLQWVRVWVLNSYLFPFCYSKTLNIHVCTTNEWSDTANVEAKVWGQIGKNKKEISEFLATAITWY